MIYIFAELKGQWLTCPHKATLKYLDIIDNKVLYIRKDKETHLENHIRATVANVRTISNRK